MLDAIRRAHLAIRPGVPVSPLEPSTALSARLGCTVLLKHEHLLPTGSFKLRGATNKLACLGPAAENGVLTASTGNHGLAVAHAAARAGIPARIYLPTTASETKRAAIARLGATLVPVEGPPINAELQARADADADNLPYISPYNDRDVIAGQGTLGIELHEQAPALDAVFIAVGGGGLVAGTGLALAALSPDTEVVGVWPENSPCMLRALEAGAIVDVPERPTLSDGTAGAIEPGSVTFPLCQQVIRTRVTVSETAIAAAMRDIAVAERWMVEGAAGCALAGLVETAARYRGKRVAVVLCGRNIALDTFLAAVAGAPAAA